MFFKHAIYVFFIPICKIQNNYVERELRSKKAAVSFYKTIYYICSTTFAFLIIKDQDYFPRYFGGNGHFMNVFNDFPYREHAPNLS